MHYVATQNLTFTKIRGTLQLQCKMRGLQDAGNRIQAVTHGRVSSPQAIITYTIKPGIFTGQKKNMKTHFYLSQTRAFEKMSQLEYT